ncbi:hypothetical protein KY345_00545 [Candidatus Woesearchaeota archaeon]|nr:hypothetical protein [Candidatus Woesearchaeota archaeon]
MADLGIDKWCLKMEEHKRKGHHLIVFDERTADEVSRDFLLKKQRIKSLEKNSLPLMS